MARTLSDKWADCGVCRGTGYEDSSAEQGEPKICSFCLGARIIRIDITCRCGRPITDYGVVSRRFGCDNLFSCQGWASPEEIKTIFPEFSAMELEQLRQRSANCRESKEDTQP